MNPDITPKGQAMIESLSETQETSMGIESSLDLPASPPELWMLWTGKNWCPPIDQPRGGENYLVCLSREDAVAAAKHQNDMYELNCVPVRVK